ncbi:hypothetical protein C6P41_003491 [Kluyveromyces marxianus]|nr:hypothetical protein C6P41_003491 [Kluyveromyces marxianus]
MVDLFDPLDFISTDHNSRPSHDILDDAQQIQEHLNYEANTDATSLKESDNDYDDIPIQPMDLPYVQYASSTVILTVLKLLQPEIQVNFKSTHLNPSDSWEKVCKEKDITENMMQETLNYFLQWGNEHLQSYSQICSKIPSLLYSKSFDFEMLNYFTSIISKYDSHPDDEVVSQILQHASLRISERCGRTAQPSMTRVFLIDGLDTEIKLHEPALTSDNLGLKTWGSSLVLSKKIINIPTAKRVLELGSGTGLVGITYALSHKNSTIFLTDLPEIVPNLQKNIELNKLNDVHGKVLDWTDPSSFTQEFGTEPFDVILIADPIYSPQHPSWVVNMIDKFLSECGKAYLEIPIRPKYEAERLLLWRLLEERNLAVVKEIHDEGKDDWGNVEYLYKEIIRVTK